jgi:hypothetical protein
MQLSTGISFVALVVSIVTLVLVFQLFTWERSEPPKDNSLACAELLTARAMVNYPDGLPAYLVFTAMDSVEQTLEKIDRDRATLGC